MRNPLTWLSRRRFPYEPLINVYISKSALIDNFMEFSKLAPNGQIAPVLKSNAYGHGLMEVANILENSPCKNHIPFFVVDSYFEAVALRSKGIKTPILIIGYSRAETIKRSHLPRTTFTVTSIATLKELEDCNHLLSIHLKLDTGMRRQGILPEEITEAIDILSRNPLIRVDGICSHFSDADNKDESFTESQINIWNKCTIALSKEFPKIKYFHISNTDGHRLAQDIKANVSRLGIGLYGLSQNSELNRELNIKPVLSMKTIVTDVKSLKVGESVGYSNTFKASRNMKIATIPVGYFEGLDRRLSNKGCVLIKNHICKIIGKVSMNITVVDVTDVSGIKIGDEVVVISNNSEDCCSIHSMAELCGAITYEFPIKIPVLLKRVLME